MTATLTPSATDDGARPALLPDAAASYARQSPWTDPGPYASLYADLPADPAAVAAVVGGLMLHPAVCEGRGIAVPEAAQPDRAMRTVRQLLAALQARDAASLQAARAPAARLYAMCASFALLAASILRARGVAARLRCGFATYFTPGFNVDHWVCEYRSGEGWRLLDAELDAPFRAQLGIGFPAHDVPRDGFVVAADMWQALARGAVDPARVGLTVPGLAGRWFAAGSLLRDAAALAMQETQVWDYWGLTRELGPGSELSDAARARLDALAADLAATPQTPAAARALIARHDGAALTATVRSFPFGAPIESPALP